MRLTAALAFTLLYGALAALATPASAGVAIDPAALEQIKDMRTGQTSKLAFHSTARDTPDTGFLAEDGSPASLADFKGSVTVVNLWATWCPPCRKEMPSLDRLHAAVAGDGIRVIAVNVERKGLVKARSFYDKIGITHLAVHADQDNAMAPRLGIIGYPVTLILDPDGREIARMQGDAEWDSPETQKLLRAIVAATNER
ncbi:MAG: thiol-disulfide isomerase/thioredoxin [Paracoccaceae bacterium]|jgi:thiol-disulfide isomerase/thioredoxin